MSGSDRIAQSHAASREGGATVSSEHRVGARRARTWMWLVAAARHGFNVPVLGGPLAHRSDRTFARRFSADLRTLHDTLASTPAEGSDRLLEALRERRRVAGVDCYRDRVRLCGNPSEGVRSDLSKSARVQPASLSLRAPAAPIPVAAPTITIRLLTGSGVMFVAR